MTDPILQVQNLTRHFSVPDKAAKQGWFKRAPTKTLVAVQDLNFEIERGEKVAFIGPNGAGKSTTLKMLSGLLHPTSGHAQVCGYTPWKQTRQLASHIGLVFGQRSPLIPALSVEDNYELLGKVYGLAPQAYKTQRERLIEVFGLQNLMPRLVRALSLGQRMRCDIAAALLHKPPVLFLDEPTIGLDVTAKALLRDHLNQLANDTDTTILLTSHDTDDIERICHRVILIDNGEKLLDTSLPNLMNDYTRTKTLRLLTEEEHPTFTHPNVTIERVEPHSIEMKIDVTQVAVEKIVSQCLDLFKVRDIGIEGMQLEDIIRTIYESRKG